MPTYFIVVDDVVIKFYFSKQKEEDEQTAFSVFLTSCASF
jgi:hypothetical protein